MSLSRAESRLPEDIRADVQRMRELLRFVVEQSPLPPAQIELVLGVRRGFLKDLLAGRAELKVGHLFRILRLTETEPSKFFLKLFELQCRAEAQKTV